MKAIVKNSALPHDLSVSELEIGTPGAHDVLLRISAVGICGSDLHMYAGHGGYRWIDYPLVLGHEICGVVSALGAQADPALLGKRVVVNPYIPCGTCDFCQRGEENRCDWGAFYTSKNPPQSLQYGFRRGGGMSEYLIVQEKNLVVLGDQVADTTAAILEAVAVSVTAVDKIAEIERKTIVVFGPGPIGLATIRVLAGLKAKKIVAVGVAGDKSRLKKAKELGADETVLIGDQAVKQLIEKSPQGYDAVLDSSGHPSVPQTAVSLLKKGSQLILIGISDRSFSLPMDQIVRGELSITGSYGVTKESFQRTVAYASRPEFHFEELISNIFPYQQADLAFQNALNQVPGKVVLSFK
ncbi:alcohol dehydrogenase catalytic domain-containing protein [Sporolactobacillus spathodeae]|uniref:Threonine dehydrogenase-like Zn-dependent dehydrogenase n=1 Tax=Sporolactobacillus spathodeae TaxID=1465502 RepID=A0ABS2QB07_9BACL|nr:threonine dehydrogenase-like Zn-dependent dehydrogenase [Sporolactobacillus spathodeae]